MTLPPIVHTETSAAPAESLWELPFFVCARAPSNEDGARAQYPCFQKAGRGKVLIVLKANR